MKAFDGYFTLKKRNRFVFARWILMDTLINRCVTVWPKSDIHSHRPHLLYNNTKSICNCEFFQFFKLHLSANAFLASVISPNGNFYCIFHNVFHEIGKLIGILTLNRLSCKTFLMATNSLVSISFAWKTTPKLPFPITRVSVYETSWTRSDPWPGVATTVVTFAPSLPAMKRNEKKGHN